MNIIMKLIFSESCTGEQGILNIHSVIHRKSHKFNVSKYNDFSYGNS
jgi:hypothetical protein